MRNLNKFFSKSMLFAAALLMLLVGCKKKADNKYKYETVKGDLTEARIYTLDNGLTVYLSVNNEEPHPDLHRCAHRFEKRPFRNYRFGSLFRALDVQGHQPFRHH